MEEIESKEQQPTLSSVQRQPLFSRMDKKSTVNWIRVSIVIFIGVIFLIIVGYALIIKQNNYSTKAVTPSSVSQTISPKVSQLLETKTLLGKELFIRDNNIYSYDEKTTKIERLTNTNSVEDFTLDGNSNSVYFLHNNEIIKLDLVNHKLTQITHSDNTIYAFLFSPDRNSIAVHTNRNTPSVIYLDGSQTILIPQPPQDLVGYTEFAIEKWHPDSNHLIIRGHGQLDTTNNYFYVDITRNSVKKFDIYGDYDIHNMPVMYYSPDGKYFAYIVDFSDVYLTPVDHFQPKKIFSAFSSWFAWSPDSTKMAVTASVHKNKGNSLVVFDINGKTIYEITSENLASGFTNITWSKNNQYVAAKKFQGHDDKIPDKLIVIDLQNKTVKELNPLMKDPTREEVKTIDIAPSNKIYYVLDGNHIDVKDKTLPQVWVWDFLKETNTKVSDFASLSIFSMIWIQ